MKTKIGPDEKIPDELLEKINTSLSSYKTENTVHIPIYDQLHQANVCVICDRFITMDYCYHQGQESKSQGSIYVVHSVTKPSRLTKWIKIRPNLQ
jgi:hypothetical protein